MLLSKRDIQPDELGYKLRFAPIFTKDGDNLKMGLMHDQFELVREGSKTIEIRLNDQKRQQLRVGDPIVFEDLTTQQQMNKRVAKLEKFASFAQLYDHYQGTVVGSAPTDSVVKMVSDAYQIYSKQQEAEHGVLAIHLE